MDLFAIVRAVHYDAVRSAAAAGKQVVRPDDDGSDAVVSTAPSVTARLDDPVARGLLGGVLGLLVGVGIAMGLAQMDRRLWTRDTVEDAFDLPVLADIATFRGDHSGENLLREADRDNVEQMDERTEDRDAHDEPERSEPPHETRRSA
jgi:hypothetical protein